jgi:hypothetical protein
MFKRGPITNPTLVLRNALGNLPMSASLETPSQKPNGKKGMEKRARTFLGLHILTLVTMPSSVGNYLQVPSMTCFDPCVASLLASRINVVEVLVIDACCNIFKISLISTRQRWCTSPPMQPQPLLGKVSERSFTFSSWGGISLEVDDVVEAVEVVEVESHLKWMMSSK